MSTFHILGSSTVTDFHIKAAYNSHSPPALFIPTTNIFQSVLQFSISNAAAAPLFRLATTDPDYPYLLSSDEAKAAYQFKAHRQSSLLRMVMAGLFIRRSGILRSRATCQGYWRLV